MIELSIQIKMIIFSIIFGIFIYFLTNVVKKIIYHKNKKLKIIFTFTFFILNAIIYFLILKKINNAIIDRNLLLMFFLGVYLGHLSRKVTKKILKHKI